MPPFVCKASFSNASPIVTPKLGLVGNIVCPIGGGGTSPNGNTQVAAANTNRAVFVLRNESATDDLRYDYVDSVTLITDGFLLKASEAIDIEPQLPIFVAGITAPVTISFDERTA